MEKDREVVPVNTKAEAKTFIHYNRLDREDRWFFAHCGLDRFVGVASKILRNRITDVELYKFDEPLFSETGFSILNQLVMEMLVLIGNHSNHRFGPEPMDQDRYFRKPSERDSFPLHLCLSRWQEGYNQLIRTPQNKEKIAKYARTPGLVFSRKQFKGIAAAKKLTYGPSKLSESETRAVGVLYMIDLAWTTALENRDLLASGNTGEVSLSRIFQASFSISSILDGSDHMIAHSEGGKAGNKKRDFRRAIEIIQAIAGNDPGIDTAILAKRAQQLISTECEQSECPGTQRIKHEIVKAKKAFEELVP